MIKPLGILIASLFLMLFIAGIFSLIIQIKKIKRAEIKDILYTVFVLIGTIVIATYLFKIVRFFIG